MGERGGEGRAVEQRCTQLKRLGNGWRKIVFVIVVMTDGRRYRVNGGLACITRPPLPSPPLPSSLAPLPIPRAPPGLSSMEPAVISRR